MSRIRLALAACVLVALLPACRNVADLTAPDHPSYNGGMAGSGHFADDNGGMAGSGGSSTATADTTATSRDNGGMAGSGH
jgi:hypothetical protein